MAIDWTKPIETVPNKRNPNPVPCEFAEMSNGDAAFFIRGDWFDPRGQNQRDDDDSNFPWYADPETGDPCYENLPLIRNVEPGK